MTTFVFPTAQVRVDGNKEAADTISGRTLRTMLLQADDVQASVLLKYDGTPGSVIEVQQNGVSAGSTFSTINFTGAAITAADAGGGVATITSAFSSDINALLAVSTDAGGGSAANVGAITADTAGAHEIMVGTDTASASMTGTTTGSLAIGPAANTASGNAVSVGDQASVGASGVQSVALGKTSVSNNASTTAIGTGANASVESAVALGKNANITASFGVVVGAEGDAGLNSVALGSGASAAMGADARSTCVAIGTNSLSQLNDVAIGKNSVSTSNNSAVAIGYAAANNATLDQMCIGKNCISGRQGTVIGHDTNISGGFTTTVMGSSTSNASDSTGVGHNMSMAVGCTVFGSGVNAFLEGMTIGGVPSSQLTSRVDDEVLTRGMRRVKRTQTTTDATPTVLVSMPLNVSGDAVLVEVFVSARRTNGSGETYSTTFSPTHFRNKSGTVTQDGTPTQTQFDTDVTGYAASLGVNGTDVRVEVTGAVGENVDWVGYVVVYCS